MKSTNSVIWSVLSWTCERIRFSIKAVLGILATLGLGVGTGDLHR